MALSFEKTMPVYYSDDSSNIKISTQSSSVHTHAPAPVFGLV